MKKNLVTAAIFFAFVASPAFADQAENNANQYTNVVTQFVQPSSSQSELQYAFSDESYVEVVEMASNQMEETAGGKIYAIGSEGGNGAFCIASARASFAAEVRGFHREVLREAMPKVDRLAPDTPERGPSRGETWDPR